MVKQINVYFDDEEHERLEKEKGKLSWHDFIMKLIEDEQKNDRTKTL